MKQKLPKNTDLKPKDTYPVGDDYFENLEKSLLSRVKKGAFVLESDIPLALVAPKGYFEILEQDVFDETINIKPATAPSLTVSYKRNWAPVFRVAALLVAVLGLGWAALHWSGTNETTASLSDIQEEEILAYLDAANVDETLLLDVFDSEFDDLNTGSNPLDLESDISEEDLQYFIDEDDLLEI